MPVPVSLTPMAPIAAGSRLDGHRVRPRRVWRTAFSTRFEQDLPQRGGIGLHDVARRTRPRSRAHSLRLAASPRRVASASAATSATSAQHRVLVSTRPTRCATGPAGHRRFAACAACCAARSSRTAAACSLGTSVVERLGEPADDGERSAQLVRRVGHEISPHGLEPPNRREIEQRDDRPTVASGLAVRASVVVADLVPRGLGRVPLKRPPRSRSRSSLARKEGHPGREPGPSIESRRRPVSLTADNFCSRIDRDHAFVQRLNEGRQDRPVPPRGPRDAAQLLGQPIDSVGEIADLARSRERRPPLRSPAASDRATSRSSTTGRATEREKRTGGERAESAMGAAARTSVRARAKSS